MEGVIQSCKQMSWYANSDSRFMCYDSPFDMKADRIVEFVRTSGDMGYSRDMSYSVCTRISSESVSQCVDA